jgi:hypothetical protein
LTQTVLVSGVDDAVVDGDADVTLQLVVSSAAIEYASLSMGSILASNKDGSYLYLG